MGKAKFDKMDPTNSIFLAPTNSIMDNMDDGPSQYFVMVVISSLF